MLSDWEFPLPLFNRLHALVQQRRKLPRQPLSQADFPLAGAGGPGSSDGPAGPASEASRTGQQNAAKRQQPAGIKSILPRAEPLPEKKRRRADQHGRGNGKGCRKQ